MSAFSSHLHAGLMGCFRNIYVAKCNSEDPAKCYRCHSRRTTWPAKTDKRGRKAMNAPAVRKDSVARQRRGSEIYGH